MQVIVTSHFARDVILTTSSPSFFVDARRTSSHCRICTATTQHPQSWPGSSKA